MVGEAGSAPGLELEKHECITIWENNSLGGNDLT